MKVTAETITDRCHGCGRLWSPVGRWFGLLCARCAEIWNAHMRADVAEANRADARHGGKP